MFNIGKKLGMYFLAGSFVFAFAGAAMAQHGHGGMDMTSHGSMSTQGGWTCQPMRAAPLLCP